MNEGNMMLQLLFRGDTSNWVRHRLTCTCVDFPPPVISPKLEKEVSLSESGSGANTQASEKDMPTTRDRHETTYSVCALLPAIEQPSYSPSVIFTFSFYLFA